MTTLARKLRAFDYFALGFGSMNGAGGLVVMDDWLGRGGPVVGNGASVEAGDVGRDAFAKTAAAGRAR